MAHTYAHLYRLPVTGLRFFTVYGPWGRPDMALFLFTRNILAGKPIDVFNYGHHRRDFTYVDDIVEGVVRACDRIAAAESDWDGDEPDPASSQRAVPALQHRQQQPVELLRYIEVLEECLGRKAEKNLLPLQAGRRARHLGRHRRPRRATWATRRHAGRESASAASSTGISSITRMTL